MMKKFKFYRLQDYRYIIIYEMTWKNSYKNFSKSTEVYFFQNILNKEKLNQQICDYLINRTSEASKLNFRYSDVLNKKKKLVKGICSQSWSL